MKKNTGIIVILILTAALFLFCGCSENASPEDNNSVTVEIPQSHEDIPVEGSLFGIEIIDNDVYTERTTFCDVTKDRIVSGCTMNGMPLAYSDYNSTFYASVDRGSEFSDYSVSFDCTCSINAVRMSYDKFTGTIDDAVTSGYSFLFLALENKQCRLYRLVLTYLPVMTVTGRDCEPYSPQDTYNPFSTSDSEAFMTLQTPSSYSDSETLIHARGGSSLCFPKSSYKLNLKKDSGDKKNKLNLLGMREDDDWILLAMYTDESKIRDKLSMDVWLEIGAKNEEYGLEFGTKIEYIELVINNCYWGIYGLTVPVDKTTAQIKKDSGEILVKTESWEIPSSHDMKHANHRSSVGSVTIKTPDIPDQNDWDTVNDFVSLIFESSNDEFSSRITDHIDIETAVNHWIFVNTISGVDNTWKNMFMTFKKSDSGYKVLLCPWDCDISWGVTWTGKTALFWEKDMDYLVNFVGSCDIANRMFFTVDGASEYLVKRWKSLRKDVLSESSLFERADKLNDTIRGCMAYSRDEQRWPDGGHTDDVNNDYIKDFITQRMAFLDSFVANFE